MKSTIVISILAACVAAWEYPNCEHDNCYQHSHYPEHSHHQAKYLHDLQHQATHRCQRRKVPHCIFC
ncbi:hypothetical protein H633G_11722 [Metarhizium anisopliae BRIP 53284]|nr:hypothetical protein H633G_11722 [Metarhizium anisopliae BRIP 53284]